LRFYFEHYNNARNGTDISRDPPTAADFPRYGSPEFITQSGMPTEELTPPSQTPPDLTATHGDSGDSQDEMHEEGIVGSEARDGSDASAEPAALPYDFDNLPNDMSIFDYAPLDNVFRSPFHHV
jgi:hypothetical protein